MNFARIKKMYLDRLNFWVLPLILSPAVVWVWAKTVAVPAELPATKINLALRRTAHHLLREAGDSTGTIAPVTQMDAHTWLIRLERSFSYDRLPALLQESFEVHGIQSGYDVAVLRCSDGALFLGYNAQDYAKNQGIPCGGRDIEADCWNLQVIFEKPSETPMHWAWLTGSGLFVLGLLFSRNKRRDMPDNVANISLENQGVMFGKSRLDMAEQTLFCGNERHALTYREAKLLHLFVSQPNQLLERGQILQQVWADEGVLVGRSVDMFVSRLRKHLRADPSVRIVAVHGVGYRLEVDAGN